MDWFLEHLPSMISALVALVAAVTSINNSRRLANSKIQISEIHLSINSRMDQLLAATVAASHAEGMRDERDAVSKKKEI